MAQGNTNFGNAAGNGTVGADGFNGPLTGNVTGSVNTTPQVVAATGSNSQSGSAPVVPGYIIVSTVTATTRAIRLSVMGTGNTYNVFNDTATAMKVYPGTNGTIGSLSTNTATPIAAHKATEFYFKNKTHAVTQVGA